MGTFLAVGGMRTVDRIDRVFHGPDGRADYRERGVLAPWSTGTRGLHLAPIRVS